jgi:hypothetical protein
MNTAANIGRATLRINMARVFPARSRAQPRFGLGLRTGHGIPALIVFGMVDVHVVEMPGKERV